MSAFKKFVDTALDLALDLYTIVGGVILLFIVYGFLWLIVSMVWKKIHKPSYLYVVNTFRTTFGKKPVKDKEEVEEDEKENKVG